MKYKVFTNDRGSRNGYRMYSCFRDVDANSAAEALRKARVEPSTAKAVRWPPFGRIAKEWLRWHVGENL